MLSSIRKRSKLIMAGIIILIIPAFVLWGVTSAIKTRSGNYAAKVFGKKISVLDYNNSFKACQIKAIMLWGEDYNKNAQFIDLESEAWRRIIFLEEAIKKGLTVTNDELINHLKRYPFFQHQGSFDKQRYYYILARVFAVTPEQFEKIEKENLLIAKIQTHIADGILISDNELFEEYKIQKTQVKANYVFINALDFVGSVKVEKNNAIEFFNNYKALFRIEEQRKVEIIKLQKEDVPGKSDLIIEDLLDNKTMLETAKKFNVEVLESELLLRTSKNIKDIPEKDAISIIGQAFRQKFGESSDIIEGENNFYIIKVNDIKEPYIPEFDQVSEQVETALKTQLSLDLAKTAAENFREKALALIKDGDSFEQAISKLGIQVKTTEAFNLTSFIKDIGSNPLFNKSAFSLKIGEISEVIPAQQGSLFLTPIERIEVTKDDFLKDEKLNEFNLFFDSQKLKEWDNNHLHLHKTTFTLIRTLL